MQKLLFNFSIKNDITLKTSSIDYILVNDYIHELSSINWNLMKFFNFFRQKLNFSATFKQS